MKGGDSGLWYERRFVFVLQRDSDSSNASALQVGFTRFSTERNGVEAEILLRSLLALCSYDHRGLDIITAYASPTHLLLDLVATFRSWKALSSPMSTIPFNFRLGSSSVAGVLF